MLKQLNPREKLMISAGVGALAVILVVYAGVLPLIEHRERSRRQAVSKEKELLEMMAYRDEYDQLKAENLRTAAILKKRPANFSLFSFLDQLAGSAGIKSKIIYMKPSTVTDAEKQSNRARVEIKLDEVNLEQISRFLYRIETSPHLISVPRLSIKQKKQASGFLETVLQVETLGT
jgi:general secretion pathway protein M